MLEVVRSCAVQCCPAPNFDRSKNLEFILSTMAAEADKGCHLIVFPETSVTNFFTHGRNGFRELVESSSITLESEEIKAICDQARNLNLFVVVGFNERSSVYGVVYNSAALIGPNGIVGVSRKQNFPGIEKLYYTPGPRLETFSTELGKIGIIICYDVLFPEIARHHFRNAADILVFSSSFWIGGDKGGTGDPVTKRKLWQELPFVTSIQNQAFVISANACGTANLGAGDWERMGLSQIVSPTDGILAQAGQSEPTTLRAKLEREKLIEARTNYRFFSEIQQKHQA